jgi:polyvinyl alcohol dehydrogenase (cytochrome)
MMSIAYPLERSQREAVAKFLGTPGGDGEPSPAAFCASRDFAWTHNSSASWAGWSPSALNTRFQPAEQAKLSVAQVRNLKLKWAFGFDRDITAFAAPTVENGVLFVGSASGRIQSMNAKSGCLYWTFQADGPVRAATVIAEYGARRFVLFGDQIGWFYSVDALTGRLQWKRRVDPHEATRLTGSAVALEGIVFVPAASWEETRSGNPKYSCCTFRGSVTALRISDGSVVWKAYTVGEPKKMGVNRIGTPQFGPSGAGIWSAPTIDSKRGLLYIATGDNYSQPPTKTSDAVLALSLKTGEIVWSQQMTAGDVFSGAACPDDNSPCGPDFDFGSSVLLVSREGRDRLIAGQKSGVVYALDPDAKGRILWQARVGKGGITGGIQWGMAGDEDRVYAAVSDFVDLPSSSDKLPLGGRNFDPRQGGGLTALQLSDGSKVWFAPSYPCTPPRPGCSPAQSAALTAIPGAVFSGSLDGHIRAFSAGKGTLLWDFDTETDFHTVNGVTAKGGSLDGAGPVIVDGMVYVNSGYPRFGGAVGNVLLAFGADDSKKE